MAKFASDTNNIGNPSDEDYCKGFDKGCNGKGMLFNSANANAVINKIDQRICDLEAQGAPVTYSISGAVPDPLDPLNCIITLSGSDGSTTTATVVKPEIPEDTGTYYAATPPVLDTAAATITWATVNDGDGAAGPDQVLDISGLIALLTSPNYVAGGNITLTTLANGDIEISATDTDTDTFGTLTGPDASGDFTWTPAGVGTPVTISPGTSSDMTRNADGSFTHSAGGTDTVIPLDLTEGEYGTEAIPAAQHGLSAGQLAEAHNWGGFSSPTQALWDSAKSLMYSVAPRSIISALYNSALNGVVGAVVGIRNKSGALGGYHHVYENDLVGALEDNNAIVLMDVDPAVTHVIPNGEYVGHQLKIHWKTVIGGRPESYVQVRCRQSRLRALSHIQGTVTSTGAAPSAITRPGEVWEMTWGNDGRWYIQATLDLHSSGSAWQENENALVTQWFGGDFDFAGDGAIDAVFPALVINPPSSYVSASDVAPGSTLGAGPLPSPDIANSQFAFDSAQNTNATIRVMKRDHTEGDTNPQSVAFMSTRHRLDYVALGGVA